MIDIEDSATGRPSYWNIEMPEYCRVLPSWFKNRELCYGPTLYSELEKFNPDIVMLGAGWYMFSWMQGYRWAVKHGKKIIAGPIEFSNSLFKISKILRNRFIYKYLYKKVDMYFANAFLHYDYMDMALGLKNKTLFMNYDDYAPYLEQSIRGTPEKIKFLYAGAIDRRMRVPELIGVFESLHKKYGNIELVIGGYGPEKSKCIEIVKNSADLTDSVIFYDVTSWEDIPAVYSECDVLINYASFSPGSGVILSAIASGMGIISTISIHASRHFMVDNFNGFIVENQEQLYLAMERYVIDKDVLIDHSKRSKEIGESNLTFKTHLEDFNMIVNSLIEVEH